MATAVSMPCGRRRSAADGKISYCLSSAAFSAMSAAPRGPPCNATLAADATADVFRHFREWHRPGDQITLHLIAAEQSQHVRLFLRIDTFRNHLETESMRQLDDGGDQGQLVGVIQHHGDEGTIDLEKMRW